MKFMRLITRTNIFLWIILILSFAVQAQTVKPTTRVEAIPNGLFIREEKLDSKLMARQMPYNLILPNNYDSPSNKSNNYAVIYLLHGLTGHFDNWAAKTKLAEYAVNYQYIIVMPEGNNGWYSDSVAVEKDKYESYIVQELITEIDKKFRTISDKDHRVIAGLSMGGYGAVKFGLKYPEKFVLVGSFSGALGATSFTEKNAGMIGKGIDEIFGDEMSENRKSNDIFKLVREISDEKKKTLPFIYQSCGTEDFLIQNNHDFASLLFEKKIPHEYRELPGVHDWKFWDAQVKEFLETAEKFIK
ncbi:alpha/beta hydrolase family protein [soil metagenome]